MGALTGTQRGQVQQTIGSIQAEMKKNINNYVPQDYVQAKKFLDGLHYELFTASS
jgi:hypothetical protein